MTKIKKSVAKYALPRALNNNGQERKIGIELEFAGLTTEQTAKILRKVLGGRIVIESEHRHLLRETSLGDVTVELDTQFAHATKCDENEFLRKGRELVGSLSRPIVPQEIVTGPLKIDQFGELDKAFNALAHSGAKGTDASIGYAFGLHFNPEVASFAPEYLTAVMRAMTLHDSKIRTARETDITREVMGWAKPYTSDFENLIMDEAYSPDISTLINDYVRLNNGRNHSLDMLPVFKHIDEKLLEELIGSNATASRPTFHYRLPSSRIDEKDWSFLDEWQDWIAIENTAEKLLNDELKLQAQR